MSFNATSYLIKRIGELKATQEVQGYGVAFSAVFSVANFILLLLVML